MFNPPNGVDECWGRDWGDNLIVGLGVAVVQVCSVVGEARGLRRGWEMEFGVFCVFEELAVCVEGW